MTGNTAQVFPTDAEWDAALRRTHDALRPGGRLVFEARDPGSTGLAGMGIAPARCRGPTFPGLAQSSRGPRHTDIRGDLVSFRAIFVFGAARS